MGLVDADHVSGAFGRYHAMRGMRRKPDTTAHYQAVHHRDDRLGGLVGGSGTKIARVAIIASSIRRIIFFCFCFFFIFFSLLFFLCF